jgi:hypothetical protein
MLGEHRESSRFSKSTIFTFLGPAVFLATRDSARSGAGQKSKHGGKSHCTKKTRRGSEPVGAAHNHGKSTSARDADPSNVSPLVHAAEMRVAETRAVNRAPSKAYGIGICSVEEIGSFAEPAPSSRESKKLRSQPVDGKNGNRARLCQLIRQHQLDTNLVKSCAFDLCGSAEGLGQIFCFGNQ